jgi:hypothetical protein
VLVGTASTTPVQTADLFARDWNSNLEGLGVQKCDGYERTMACCSCSAILGGTILGGTIFINLCYEQRYQRSMHGFGMASLLLNNHVIVP